MIKLFQPCIAILEVYQPTMTTFYILISELLSYKFPLTGLSETKISVDKEFISNINIPGYTFISEPSHSNAGRVAFYINDNLKYIIKSKYTKSTYDFEALWIEIEFTHQSNIICGVIYGHPSGNLDNFLDYINSTIESINQENKFCLFMGDFNIDLLKIDTHTDSQNFIILWAHVSFSLKFFNQKESLTTLPH